jgi:hypothetical protein
MTVEQHAAKDARNNQPGFGLEPAPPIAGGMSVSTSSPDGPATRHINPLSRVAVAGAYLALALSGLARSPSLTLFQASAIACGVISISLQDLDAGDRLAFF